MRVVLLTQDDPFLPKAIKKLHAGLPNDIEWVGTVLFEVSPLKKRIIYCQNEKDFGCFWSRIFHLFFSQIYQIKINAWAFR